jgi:hypothetical protein
MFNSTAAAAAPPSGFFVVGKYVKKGSHVYLGNLTRGLEEEKTHLHSCVDKH